MKRNVVSCLMLGAFMLVLTGMPLQLLHIDLVKSAYAYISYGQNHDWDRILGQGNDGEHGDLYNILERGNDLIKILGRDNKRDDRGQEGNGENNWYQSDERETFRVKDDDCKDLQDQGEHGRGNYRHIVYGRHDDGCDRHFREHEDHHKRDNCKVPEPSMFSLLGAGIAGVGVYSFIRRRSSK